MRSRRGVSDCSSTYQNVQLTTELVRRAAHMGVDWVTVHGRTPSQRSTDPARWHDVAQLITAQVPHHIYTAAPLPIFLNGDVKSLNDAFQAYQISGCQGKWFFDTPSHKIYHKVWAALVSLVFPIVARHQTVPSYYSWLFWPRRKEGLQLNLADSKLSQNLFKK